MVFAIKGQTKVAAAFTGNFGVYGPILFKLCVEVAYCSHPERLIMAFAIKGKTKACSEKYVQSFSHSYKMVNKNGTFSVNP